MDTIGLKLDVYVGSPLLTSYVVLRVPLILEASPRLRKTSPAAVGAPDETKQNPSAGYSMIKYKRSCLKVVREKMLSLSGDIRTENLLLSL